MRTGQNPESGDPAAGAARASRPPIKKRTARRDSHPSRSRDPKLDALRAIGIVLVVVWHYQPLLFTSGNPQNSMSQVPANVVEALYRQITLIAVPLLFIVALYLLYTNLAERPGYIRRRVRRLGALYLFWTFVQFAVWIAVGVLGNVTQTGELALPGSIGIRLLVMGGPSLPLVGEAVFYFLFNLVILSVLAFAFSKMPERIRMPLAVALTLLSIAYFELCNLRSIYIPYWRIDNFLVYVPVAYMLKNSHLLYRLRYFILGGFIVFSIHDILLTHSIVLQTPILFQTYGRVSAVLGALAAFCITYSHYTGVSSRSVRFLSRHSLGIYATHKYMLLSWYVIGVIFLDLFVLLAIPRVVFVHDVGLNIWMLVSGLVGAAATLILVGIVGRTPLRRFVT